MVLDISRSPLSGVSTLHRCTDVLEKKTQDEVLLTWDQESIKDQVLQIRGTDKLQTLWDCESQGRGDQFTLEAIGRKYSISLDSKQFLLFSEASRSLDGSERFRLNDEGING